MDKALKEITLVKRKPHELLAGEAMYSELHQSWLVGCPNPACGHDPELHGIANLGNHEVTEFNGVITVSPSILCGCSAHYFIENNKIRWC